MSLLVMVAIVIALIIWAGPPKSTDAPGPDASIGKLLIAAAIMLAIALIVALMIYG
jgi:hypothetical protein